MSTVYWGGGGGGEGDTSHEKVQGCSSNIFGFIISQDSTFLSAKISVILNLKFWVRIYQQM